MSCRPVTPDIEHALRPASLVDRDRLKPFTVASGSDINAQALPDVAQESVIVVSPQDMRLVFGPTLWRKGFLPILSSDASHASPAAPVNFRSSSLPSGIAATRSFSTCIWRTTHFGAVVRGASLPLFCRVTLRASVYGPCRIRPASNLFGAVPRWFRSSLRCTGFPRSPTSRFAIVLGFAGIRGYTGRSL